MIQHRCIFIFWQCDMMCQSLYRPSREYWPKNRGFLCTQNDQIWKKFTQKALWGLGDIFGNDKHHITLECSFYRFFTKYKVIFDTTSLTSKFGRFFYFEDVFLGLLRRSIYLSRFLFVAISYKGIRTYRYLTFSHLFTWICSILQNVIWYGHES